MAPEARRTMYAQKFRLGALTVTPRALELVPLERLADGLRRHLIGDWGDSSPSQRRANDLAVSLRRTVVSVYDCAAEPFYVVTDDIRSLTHVCLPEEL